MDDNFINLTKGMRTNTDNLKFFKFLIFPKNKCTSDDILTEIFKSIVLYGKIMIIHNSANNILKSFKKPDNFIWVSELDKFSDSFIFDIYEYDTKI